MAFLKTQKRTHRCGELRKEHVGKNVVLMGWVGSRRDHGGLVFVDLRDRAGFVQVVLNPAQSGTAAAKDFRGEYVVAIAGVVRARPTGMANTKIDTGDIEVEAQSCQILSEANTPPFIFIRSGELCHVIRDEAERPSVATATNPWIRGTMSRTANWLRYNQNGELKGAFPPPESVFDLAALDPHLLPFPALSSVTEVPTLRADGTILGTPGYDPISTVYYSPAASLKTFPLPDSPTQKQVAEAKALINEAVGEFPYADQAMMIGSVQQVVGNLRDNFVG